MTDPRARFEVQVRWSDADLMGHVNHARYLTYFEDARMRMVADSPAGAGAIGAEPPKRGCIAARVCVDYLAPVVFRPGLTLLVWTGVTKLGRSSWTLAGELAQEDQAVARSEVVMVAYDYPAARSRPLDDDERAYWERFIDQ